MGAAKHRGRRSKGFLGFERALLASLLALLAGCAGGEAKATEPAAGGVTLTPGERQLMAAWKTERGLTEGDALSNVMLRRYSNAGHKVRYAGEGLYEVLDRKKGGDVIATFYVKGAAK